MSFSSKGMRVDKAKIISIIVVVLSIASLSNAIDIIYVDVNGPNDPGAGTAEDPFRRIQNAIDAANTGDIVEIRPGIYTADPNNCNLDPRGKSITIRSIDPNNYSIVSNTVINPNGVGRGFYIHSGEDANCIISGLTIKNAHTLIGYNGAGIYGYNSSPVINNCVIRDCFAEDGSGGGICFDYGTATIINCTITGNTAGQYGYGGGISCRFSSPMITGCTISDNIAYGRGGGIDSGLSDPNILNCIILGNNAPVGGGINCYYPGITSVVNCTIVMNSADYIGGAVYCQYEGSANIKNSIIWANTQQLGLEYEGSMSVKYCDVQGGQIDVYDPSGLLVWGEGNIDIDPCFASFEPDGPPNLWDFHLKSKDGRWNSTFYRIDLNNDGVINLVEFARLAGVWLRQDNNLPEDLDRSGMVNWADLGLFTQYFLANSREDGWLSDASTSPCVDAGDPNSAWMAEPWPNGKRINMGVYGGTIQASMNGNPADFDIDGNVDFADFAAFAYKWFAQESCIEDLNGNNVVDFTDLHIFADNWLWQRE